MNEFLWTGLNLANRAKTNCTERNCRKRPKDNNRTTKSIAKLFFRRRRRFLDVLIEKSWRNVDLFVTRRPAKNFNLNKTKRLIRKHLYSRMSKKAWFCSSAIFHWKLKRKEVEFFLENCSEKIGKLPKNLEPNQTFLPSNHKLSNLKHSYSASSRTPNEKTVTYSEKNFSSDHRVFLIWSIFKNLKRKLMRPKHILKIWPSRETLNAIFFSTPWDFCYREIYVIFWNFNLNKVKNPQLLFVHFLPCRSELWLDGN